MGSSGGGGDIDKKYNARMAAIAEANQELAEEMMGYYREWGLPYEAMQSEAAMSLLPYEAAYQRGLLSAGMEMMPYAQRAGQQYFDAAAEGVDRNQWAGMADMDVSASMKDVQAGVRRSASRIGLNPSSGIYADTMKHAGLGVAREHATARTRARWEADQEDYRRKQGAAQMGLGGLR